MCVRNKGHKHDCPLFDRNEFGVHWRLRMQTFLSGRYQSAAIQGIYDIRPMGSVEASVQWTSANQKAKLILKGTDLFRTSDPHTVIDWEGQRMEQRLNWDTRKVSLTFVYKFGGYKEKKREVVDMSRIGR